MGLDVLSAISSVMPMKAEVSHIAETGGAAAPARVAPTFRWSLLVVLAVTTVLHGRALTRSGPWYGDSANHLMNGIFVHDAGRHAREALAGPMEFAMEYYGHFPAVSLGYHPPVFPIVEAIFMVFFGVSHVSAQMAMLAMTLLGGAAGLAWLRRLVDPTLAMFGAIMLVNLPLFAFWGQSLNLEMPATALLLVAAWAFERIATAPAARWRLCLVFGVALSLAVWTKQHALFCVPVFIVALFARRCSHVLRTSIGGVTVAIVAVASTGVVYVTSIFGGNAVSQAGLADVENLHLRLVPEFWTYYPAKLPDILGWPLLIAAAIGLACSVKDRRMRMAVPWAWVLFYYVSHSYPYPHAMRYACLWVPPLIALAIYGVSRLRGTLPWIGRRVRVSTIAAAGLAIHTLFVGFTVEHARYPSVLRDTVGIAQDRLGKYACLSLVSDWPPRPATYFRLAVESSRLEKGTTLDEMGRLIRAEQVVRPVDRRWPEVGALSEMLRAWNVKMILFEYEGNQLPVDHHDPLVRLIAGVVVGGEFRVLERHEISLPIDDDWRTYSHSMWEGPPTPNRTLVLCERVQPLPWNPSGGPVIRPARASVKVDSSRSDS